MEKPQYLQQRFEKSPSVVGRRVADEYILVPILKSSAEIDSIYNINEVAARIWELLDGQSPVDEIRDRIVGEFEVETDRAEDDLIEFLKQLEGIGAIRAT